MEKIKILYLKPKILYLKPKGRLRELIQKFFLRVLLIFTPKKFLSNKDKIKIILHKIRVNLSYGLAVIFLRLKYPFYYMLPSQHIYALHSLIKFLKILKTEKINFFLTGGSLLGSVRQESFADVRDIDLGIKENQLSKLINAFPLLTRNNKVMLIKSELNKEEIRLDNNEPNNILESNRIERIQIHLPFILIDVAVFRKKIVDKKKIWIGETAMYYPSNLKFKGTTFPEADLDHLISINAYGKKFPAPANPEMYLKQKYGENWRTPIHRHPSPIKNAFSWKKNIKS